ncbi:MAG: hypothetical protein WAK16_12980 [Candidatus Cybelea sp.]
MIQMIAVVALVVAQATAPAPPADVTAGFTTFLTDVLAGRVPANASETMKSQSATMISQIKHTFGTYGTFRRLRYEREDTAQGYHRYHYMAVFDKGSPYVAFVTDSDGTIVGFFEDEPPAKPAGAPAPALTATFTRFVAELLGGETPSERMTAAMKSGLTPTLLSQIRNSFASYGEFQRLHFVSHDTMQTYQRYHYIALFENGKQPLLFVTDSTGAIAGFSKDENTNGGAASP